MKTLIIFLVGIPFFALVLILAVRAIDAHEMNHCYDLQAQSKIYDQFFITQTESDICTSYHIPVNAPIL